jgi:hypothetical protein
MSKIKALCQISLFVITLTTFPPAEASLINGGFELPSITGLDVVQLNQSLVPGWKTTATDSQIEIWSNSDVTAYEGTQHAELNANQAATLYQDVSGIAAGSLVGFQFAHRGRSAIADVMEFTLTDLGADNRLGGGDDTILFTQQYSDADTAWRFYTGTGITTPGNTVQFAFTAISSGNGNPSYGNFLDAADFGVGVGAVPASAVPEPSTIF